MEEQPLDKLLNELANLMDKLETAEIKPLEEWPKDIKDRLTMVEGYVALLNQIGSGTLAKANVTPEDLQKMKTEEEILATPQDLKILKKIENMKKRVDQKKMETNIELAKIQHHERTVGKKKSQEIVKRKKKFHRGGKADWKPL